MSSPTRSSATFRSARTASSATGSQASSGITCGTSGDGRPSSFRSTPRTRSRLRDFSARISITSGSPTGSAGLGRRQHRAIACQAGGERRAQRAQHGGPRGDVFDIRQVELDGAIEQTALERLDVAGAEPSGDDNRDRGARHRREQDRAVLACRRQQDQQAHETAADRVAQAIEADVDDRLGRALLVGRESACRKSRSRFGTATRGTPIHRCARQRAGKPGKQQAGEPTRRRAPAMACSSSGRGPGARAPAHSTSSGR